MDPGAGGVGCAGGRDGHERAAFYCVADERYFLGAAAMLNSLRLHGHREPVFVLDCGLTAHQRELLAPHATVVEDGGSTAPWLLKTLAPLRHPAEVMVLIDADMIVTRPLAELIEPRRRGPRGRVSKRPPALRRRVGRAARPGRRPRRVPTSPPGW